jgi:hypothetical protein
MKRKEEYQDERWKKRAAQIRELDNHKCAMCGAKDVELHVHHLSYPPPPFHLWDAADNELVTLCKECHEKMHDSVSRPTLTLDRTLIFEHDHTKCKFSGDRMVSQSLYNDLCKKGYDGTPYTQQIIDWLREKYWYFISFEPLINYRREDGSESEFGQSYQIVVLLDEIRGSSLHTVGIFADYGDAEIGAIKFTLNNLNL